MLSLVVNYSIIYSRNFHSAICACVCVSVLYVCVCVNDSAQEIKTSTTFTCVFSHVFINQITTTRGLTGTERQTDRERESESKCALCQGQPASLTLSFFHARVHTQLLIDQLLLLQSTQCVSIVYAHLMKMIYIIYRFVCV